VAAEVDPAVAGHRRLDSCHRGVVSAHDRQAAREVRGQEILLARHVLGHLKLVRRFGDTDEQKLPGT